jgi:hypothetical protein
MDPKRAVLVLVVIFAVIYYAARIGIFYAGTTGAMEFEEEQSAAVEGFVSYSFLAIGVAGLLTLPGLYLGKPWGIFGTLAVSVYTIAFDGWAFLWVQSSAAAGIAPACVLIACALLRKKGALAPG